MKPADLVTGSEQRLEAMQGLVQTEKTDAVNSGIVDSADKGLSLPGKKVATGGAGSAALAAATSRKQRGTRSRTHEMTSESVGAAGPLEAEEALPGAARALRPRAGWAAQTSPIRNGRVWATVKAGAKDGLVQKTLEGTEVEGADGLYYKGKATYRAVRATGRLAMRGTRSVARTARTIHDRIFDKGRAAKKGAKAAAQAKSRAQAAGYARRAVYTTAAKARQAAAASKAASTLAGTVAKGGLAKAAAAAAAPVIIVILLVVCLLLCVAGAGAEQERQNSSMEGLPAWVSYELVLSCLEARDEYGYPASALLGQMMIENGTSDKGSDLGRLYHNYGGVKYFGNTYGGLISGSVRMLTTEVSASGIAYQTYADFAVFASDEAFMEYRCKHLFQQHNYTSQPNYQKAIDENDSELFLTALGEGGYYTASIESYLDSYRSICESYPLVPLLDSLSVEDFENTYGGSFAGGEDYEEAEDWQKRIADTCRTTPSPGAGLCAAWVSNVYERAGQDRPYGNGNSILASSTTTSTDWSAIEVGQILSAQATPTPDGAIYGHTAIYVGGGMVMENVSGRIETTPLSEWVSYYSRYGWVKYGWPW